MASAPPPRDGTGSNPRAANPGPTHARPAWATQCRDPDTRHGSDYGRDPHPPQRAVSNLPAQFNHARTRRGHEDGGWGFADIPQPGLRAIEVYSLSPQQTPHGEYGLPHRLQIRPRTADVAHRKIAWANGQPDPARSNLVQGMGQGSQYTWMPGYRVGGGRVNGDFGGALGGQCQGQENVPAAVLVIVYPHAGETSGRSTSTDLGSPDYRPTDW